MDLNWEKFDPDWAFAVSHGEANRPGTFDKTKPTELICPCCLHRIEKDPVPYCENSKELEFIGFGYPLYFQFFKFIIILLIILVASESTLGIYWGYRDNQEFCGDHIQRIVSGEHVKCTGWMIYLSRVELALETEEIILRSVSFIIHLLSLIYIRDRIVKRGKYHSQRTTNLGDYSLLVSNIPRQTGTASKIRKFLLTGFSVSYFAEEVVCMADLGMYYKIKKEKQKLFDKIRRLMGKTQSEQIKEQINLLEEQIGKKNEELSGIYREQKEQLDNDELQCNRCVIVFSTEAQKIKMLQEFQRSDKSILVEHFGVGGDDMVINLAPQPKEIIWENVSVLKGRKILKRVGVWLATILTIAVVATGFFFLVSAKTHKVESVISELHVNEPNGNREVSILVALLVCAMLMLVVLFNKFILAPLFHHFTLWERHNSTSGFEFSFALKYCMGLFFTTAIMTLLVEDIRQENIYREDYGVIEEETIMFFLNAFVVPVIWLINPIAIVHSIKQWYYFERKNLTQREANALMEPVHYSVGKRYAEIIESLWFTYLYSSVTPIGAPIMTVGLIFYYWVDKYNLLRRSSINQNLSIKVCVKMLKLLDVTLLLKPVGEMIFDYQIRDEVHIASIVCASVALLYLLLPTTTIIEFLHQEKFLPEDRKYEDVKGEFYKNYVTLHPLFEHQRNHIIKKMSFSHAGSQRVFMTIDGDKISET